MPCGACSKARARRKAALEARRAALVKKEADKQARAAAAKAKDAKAASTPKPSAE